MADVIRAKELTPEVMETLHDMFEYHPWTNEQKEAGGYIRLALEEAAQNIIKHAPPCADRSAALRKIREARMDANSAITHGGKY